MEQTLAWCPKTGRQLNYLYPSSDMTPTPLYVEVNANAQYILGARTYVEFMFLNASDEPVTVDSFEVSLNGQLLEPGVYAGSEAITVPPGDGQGTIADRRLLFGPDELRPDTYALDVSVTFTCSGGAFTMQGKHPVVFEPPGANRIHVYDPLQVTLTPLTDGDFPANHCVEGATFGEGVSPDEDTNFIAGLKESKGLRFVPVRMAYVEDAPDAEEPPGPKRAPASESMAAPPSSSPLVRCPKCGETPTQNGAYCPFCGARLPAAVTCIEEQGRPVAYCPHCMQLGKLNGRYPFCPRDGKRIHAYLEVNEIPFYMQDIQTNIEFALIPVCDDDVHIDDFVVTLGGQTLVKGNVWLRGSRVWHSSGPERLRLDRLVRPSEDGDAVLEIQLKYETGGKKYSLRGGYCIHVLPRDADAPTINATIDNSVRQSVADGAMGSMTKYSPVELDFRGITGENKAREFIEELKERQGENYVAVELLLDEEGPTWQSMDRACMCYELDGIRYNYCLLGKRDVIMGRQKDCDVRLYEIERCQAADKAQAAQGIPMNERRSMSIVSRRQFHVQPAENGVRVAQLSKLPNAFLAGTKPLNAEEPPRFHLIGHNEAVVLRDMNGTDVLALRYAANAPSFEGLERAFRAAGRSLGPVGAAEAWCGQFGGYRLARELSLSGQTVEGAGFFPAAESYVLVPGWATIGSADNACIVVRGTGVEPLHAYLLHLAGYYFILPAPGAGTVWVDGEQVAQDDPQLLKPGSTVRLGDALMRFDKFCQCYLTSE